LIQLSSQRHAHQGQNREVRAASAHFYGWSIQRHSYSRPFALAVEAGFTVGGCFLELTSRLSINNLRPLYNSLLGNINSVAFWLLQLLHYNKIMIHILGLGACRKSACDDHHSKVTGFLHFAQFVQGRVQKAGCFAI